MSATGFGNESLAAATAVSTPERTRPLTLQGGCNFRDISGCAAQGGSARCGRVYRTAVLSDLPTNTVGDREALMHGRAGRRRVGGSAPSLAGIRAAIRQLARVPRPSTFERLSLRSTRASAARRAYLRTLVGVDTQILQRTRQALLT